MNIQEDFVSFETAKLLKEKGFPQYKREDGFVGLKYNMDGELTTSPYAEHYRVITQAMTMKWLRNMYKCCIVVSPKVTDDDGSAGCLWGWSISIRLRHQHTSEGLYESYETACEAAIRYCLENLI